MHKSSVFASPRQDIVAGIVVFLVALPLCLGIAVACGVPPISGLIAGMIGGLVVPLISRAPLSVAGPAAGLTSIVLVETQRLGSLSHFLAAVMVAGVLQFLLGVVRAGRFAAVVPSAVIKGMLAAIGITIVWKQLPVAVGVKGGLTDIPGHLQLGPTLITVLSLVILFSWSRTPFAKWKVLSPAVVVVVVATLLARVLRAVPALALHDMHFVQVPAGGLGGLLAALPRPELSSLTSTSVWIAGATIAIVASIETLLSLQAVDRLDPLRRHSPPDRELLAQGVANTLSGFLGGLPLTSVIVRSSANVAAGAQSRLATFVHGAMLFCAVVAAAPLLNQIPLACLAAVLIQVGYNLSRPALYAAQFKLGLHQLAPFAVTIAAVLALDLLRGVIVGIIVGLGFVLRQDFQGAIGAVRDDDGVLRLVFRRDATFLTKPTLLSMLDDVDDGERMIIDANGGFVDQDVKEALATFIADSRHRQIDVRLVGIDLSTAGAAGGH